MMPDDALLPHETGKEHESLRRFIPRDGAVPVEVEEAAAALKNKGRIHAYGKQNPEALQRKLLISQYGRMFQEFVPSPVVIRERAPRLSEAQLVIQ